jgi:dolichol kinase
MGIKYGAGSHKFQNGKSIVGTLGGITICMIATMVYGTLVDWELSTIFPLAFFGGLAGGLSETFVIEDINDNLFIPLVSATVLSVVYANMI